MKTMTTVLSLIPTVCDIYGLVLFLAQFPIWSRRPLFLMHTGHHAIVNLCCKMMSSVNLKQESVLILLNLKRRSSFNFKFNFIERKWFNIVNWKCVCTSGLIHSLGWKKKKRKNVFNQWNHFLSKSGNLHLDSMVTYK